MSIACSGLVAVVVSGENVWLGGGRSFQESPDELRGDLRDDSVTQSMQLSHAAGNPMSQRECSGFNAPRFSVEAGEEVVGIPCTA
jgi:hypothetical protein